MICSNGHDLLEWRLSGLLGYAAATNGSLGGRAVDGIRVRVGNVFAYYLAFLGPWPLWR